MPSRCNFPLQLLSHHHHFFHHHLRTHQYVLIYFYVLYYAYAHHTHTHTCTHPPWSYSSPLLECSLVSAVMQSRPVISSELCVLHSLPSIFFFFYYYYQGFIFIYLECQGHFGDLHEKSSLNLLMLKYPLQTIFISRIKIRYPNCLCCA